MKLTIRKSCKQRIPELERKVYIGQDFNGRPALMCTGCENKYFVYFDGNFPFIHQNWISFNLGTSYPTYSGQGVLEVVTSSQGEKVKKEVMMPNGQVKESSTLIFTRVSIKKHLDNMDQKNFTDHYADCETLKSDPSMMQISFTMGIISLLLTYVIGITTWDSNGES